MIAKGSGPTPDPGTLNRLFYDAVEKFNKPDALQYKSGGGGGIYKPISHKELEQRVRHIGLGLKELGLNPGDRVAIISENRPEWAIADYACLTSCMTDVPVYPNLPAEQAAYILKDAGVIAAFVSNREQAAKIISIQNEVPSLKHIIAFDSNTDAKMTFTDLEALGAAKDKDSDSAERYKIQALTTKPDDIATIIYTSGTTGNPKGVMLSHNNIHSNVAASMRAIPFAGEDVCLSFLPLSHIFERMAGHYLMIAMGSSIAYAESMETVPQNIVEVRPTLVLSVPRLYEKIYAKLMDNRMAARIMKSPFLFWARGLVYRKLRKRTGGRLRYFVSGGAPLAPEINRFFYSARLTILEGYGLTETSPVITVNRPGHFRIGTVGKPIDGVEVMIASDGEICTRGPGVMKGYYNNPDATREAIDAEGWLHTGDIGELRDGFLTITDRKKDIIVTAGGKNIAPQPIENKIKTNKYVAQAVMIGDKRKFPVILIVPDFDQLEKWAVYKKIAFTDRAQLLKLPEVQSKMEREVFGELSTLAQFEMPKKVALLENDFSIERGELTPSLKVKRRVIDRDYKEIIDGLYQE